MPVVISPSVISPCNVLASGGVSDLDRVIALGPTVLYDISQLSSLYADRSATPSTPASVGGVVGAIKDLSGNGNHAIAPNDASRGILRQSGDYYYIELDGIDDCYVAAAPGVTFANMGVFCTVEQTVNVGFRGIITLAPSMGVDASEFNAFVVLHSGGSSDVIVSESNSASFLISKAASGATPLAVYEMRKNTTLGTLFINGAAAGTDASFSVGAAHSGDLLIGARFSSAPTNFLVGNFYGSCIFETDVSANVATIREYMAALAGITL